MHSAWLLAALEQDRLRDRRGAYESEKLVENFKGPVTDLLNFTISKNHVRDPSFDPLFEEALNDFKGGDTKLNIFSSFIPAMCGFDSHCLRATRKALFLISPHPFIGDSGYLSFPENLREVRDEPLYSRAAALMVKKFISEHPLSGYSEEDTVHNQSVTGNLYDDAYNSFKILGVSSEKINHYVMALLSLYGMRGSTTGLFAFIPFRYADGAYTVFELMQLISYHLNYFDLLNDLHGRPFYSLPAGVKRTCFYDRPYHFWMSAAIVTQLRERGFAPLDAVRAAHELGLIYERLGGVGNKKATFVFTDESYRIETTKNLVLNDAGAFWAADFKPLSTDHLLLHLLNSADQNSWFWLKRVGVEQNITSIGELLREGER